MNRHRSTARGDAVPAFLRECERARVDDGWVRGVGDGEVLGAVLVVFGLGGGAGRVFEVRGAKPLVAAAWFISESICSYPVEQENKLL